MAKIRKYSTDEQILHFTNGSAITTFHEQDCCEWNYADFDQIDDIAQGWDFDMENLTFEKVIGGFRFGNLPSKMVFVPCYSEQNGYYSNDIDIQLEGFDVLHIDDLEVNYR